MSEGLRVCLQFSPDVRKDAQPSTTGVVQVAHPTSISDFKELLRLQFDLSVEHAEDLLLMWNGFPLPSVGNILEFLRDGEQITVQRAPADAAAAAAVPGLMSGGEASLADTAAAAALQPAPLPSAAGEAPGDDVAQAALLPMPPPLNADPPPYPAPQYNPAPDFTALQLANLPPEILQFAALVMPTATAEADPNAVAVLQHLIQEHLKAQAAQQAAGSDGSLPLGDGSALPGVEGPAGMQLDGTSLQQQLHQASGSGADAAAVAVGAAANWGSYEGGEHDAKRRRLADGTAAPGDAAGVSGEGLPQPAGDGAMAVDGASAAALGAMSFTGAMGVDGGMGMLNGMNPAFLESIQFLSQQMAMQDPSVAGGGAPADPAAAAAAFEAHLAMLTSAHAQANGGLVGYDGTPGMLPPVLPLAGLEGGGGEGGLGDATQNYVQMLLNSRLPPAGLEQLAAAAVAAQMSDTPGGVGGVPNSAALLAAALANGSSGSFLGTPSGQQQQQQQQQHAAGEVSEDTEDDAPHGSGPGRRGGRGSRGGRGRGGGGGGRGVKPLKSAVATAAAASAALAAANPANMQAVAAAAMAGQLAGMAGGFPNLGMYGYGLLDGFDPAAMMAAAAGMAGQLPGGMAGQVVPAGPKVRSWRQDMAQKRRDAELAAAGGEGSGAGMGADDDSGDEAKREAGKAGRITILRLKEVYHLNIEEAAKELGIGMTKLKEHCRQLGIPRWPSRKLRSMDKLIESLHEQAERDPGSAQMVDEVIAELQHFKDMIYHDPSVEVEEHIKRLRQSNFKKEYQQRQTTQVNPREDGDTPAGTSAPRHGSARQAAAFAAAAAAQEQANAAAVALLNTIPGMADLGATLTAAQLSSLMGELPGGLTLAQLMQSQQAMAGLGLPQQQQQQQLAGPLPLVGLPSLAGMLPPMAPLGLPPMGGDPMQAQQLLPQMMVGLPPLEGAGAAATPLTNEQHQELAMMQQQQHQQHQQHQLAMQALQQQQLQVEAAAGPPAPPAPQVPFRAVGTATLPPGSELAEE